MPRMTKKYISWMLSALMCFSNSFTVIRAEEETPVGEQESQEVIEEEQVQEITEVTEQEDPQEETTEETPEVVQEKEPEEDPAAEVISEDEENQQEEQLEEEDIESEDPAEDETVQEEKELSEEEKTEEAIFEELTEDSDVFSTSASDFSYTVSNDEVTITKYLGNSTTVEIPSTIDGYPVISIGNWAFSGKKTLTSITIANSVLSIGEYAFYNCGLTSITFPDGLKRIGTAAFAECNSLISVSFPESINEIMDGAFACKKLQTVFFSGNMKAWRNITIGGYNEPLINASIQYGKEDDPEYDPYTDSCGTSCQYTIDNGILIISGSGAIKDYTANDLPHWYHDSKIINKIVVQDGITEIGDYAFRALKNVTEVVLPNGVINIGEFAFLSCTGLTAFTMPGSVRNIGDHAFSGCFGLTRVSVDDIENWLQISFCDEFSNPLSLAKKLFINDEEVVEINVPSTIKKVEDYAFCSMSNLKNITISEGVISIGCLAFYNCSCLTNITIPNSVRSIGKEAFNGCSNLSSVIIPNGVTSIGDKTFNNCSNLTYLSIPDSVSILGKDVFCNCKSLTCITIPEGVTEIPDGSLDTGMFYGCAALTTVNLPKTLNKIGSKAFYWCHSLSFVELPDSLVNIGDYAFTGCSEITSLIIPPGIQSISQCTFLNCTKLNVIMIPESVTNIGKNAFKSCGAIKDVYYSGTQVQWNAITIDDGNEYLTNANRHVKTNPDDFTFSIVNGKGTITGYTGTDAEIEIPQKIKGRTVESIADSAFAGNTIITNVTIANTVSSIGNRVFKDCSSLNSVSISDSVTSLGYSAFYNCTSLTEVSLSENITELGDSTFSKCSNLETIKIPTKVTNIEDSCFDGCSKLTEIVLPEGIKVIDALVFSGCTSLKSITIPRSVTSVEFGAFMSTKSLNDIYYSGTQEEWNAISFGKANDALNTATKHFDLCLYHHDYDTPEYLWTETENGYSVYAKTICKNDSSHILEETVLTTYLVTQAATCEENGIGLYTTDFENSHFSAQTKEENIPALGHEYRLDRIVWIGNEEEGFTAVNAQYTCAHDHMHKASAVGKVKTVRTEPSCEQDGSAVYTAVITAEDSLDGIEHTDTKTTVIPALGHDYQEPEYIWTETENGYLVTESTICKRDPEHKLEESVEAVYSVSKAPACEKTGIGVYTASFANEAFSTQTKEIELEALGHDYQFSSFLWTGNDEEGYTNASAEYICTHDESHKQTAEGTVKVHRTEPTCEEDGSVVYTAAITAENSIDGKEHTDTKTVVIPALGHVYQEPVYTWTETENGYSVSATSECERDPSHRFEETVETVYSVTKPAVCEKTGIGVYTASFTDSAFSTQTKEITLEALGHDYQFSEFKWAGNDRTGYTAASAEYVCTHDSAHKQTKEAEITSVRTEPTCEAAGNIVYTVAISEEDSIDGKAHSDTKTVVLAATGHNYGTPQYKWEDTAGGYRVKASAVCQNDESHVLSETVNAVYQVTKAPTCEMTGTGVYTATFNNSHFRSQTKTVMIPATGHEYEEPEYTWVKTDAGYTVTAKTICRNDSSHVVTETVTAGFKMIDDPSQEYKKGLYTAEFENELFETQTKIWTFVSRIQIDQAEVTFHSLDETVTLHATVLPEAADNKAYHWESSDETIAVVDENGIITPVSNGSVVVKAVTEEGGFEAECKVTVDVQTTGLEIDYAENTVERGDTVQLSAIVSPEEANNKSVRWTSSDPEVASVDKNGLVTAVKSGTAVITAKTEDTGIEAECIIHVITSVQSVSLEESQITVLRGETTQLHAEIEPVDADNLKLNWKSSDENVVTVDESGLVSAVERGDAVITVTAEDGGSSAQCVVSVEVIAQSIALNQSVRDIFVGESYQLAVTVDPADADLSTLIWSSSDDSIATVDQEGNVTALGKGQTIITVETQDGTYKENCLIKTHVKPAEIRYESDNLAYNTMFLRVGEAIKLENITIIPEESSDAPLQYATSNSQVAYVGTDSIIHAVSKGTATISIMSGDASTSFDVVVTNDLQTARTNKKLIDYIVSNGIQTASHYSYGRYVGNASKYYVDLQYYPETNKIIFAFTYTDTNTNTETIQVSYGYFFNDLTAVEINVRSKGKSEYIQEILGRLVCELHDVTLAKSLNYAITPNPTTLPNSISQPLLDTSFAAGTAAIDIALNNIGLTFNSLGFTSIDITDEIDTPAYLVNTDFVEFLINNGKYTGSAYRYGLDIDSDKEHYVAFEYIPDKDKIYLTYTFVKKKTSTVVESVHLSYGYYLNDLATVDILNSVTLNRVDLTGVDGKVSCGFDEVTVSQSMQYSTTVFKLPYYSVSDSEVQSVLDTMFKSGTKMIESVLNRNGFSLYSLGFTSIGVESNAPMTGLSVKPTSKSVYVGETITLSAIKKPLIASGTLVWSSSNTTVATVDQNGNVKAIKEGIAVITVKSSDGLFKASCTITSKKPVKVTGITISSTFSSVDVGNNILLSADISPSNATNKAITWSSSNSNIATVDQKGVVRGVSGGEAVIQAVTADGHYTASKTITVTIPLESISFTQKEVKLAIRDSVQIDPVFEPENASNKNLKWESLDEKIALVDEKGKVTAVSEGETTIICTSAEDGHIAHYQLKAYTVYAEGIHIKEKPTEIEFGHTNTIKIAFEPENTTNQKLIWTSSDESIATVDENGVITAVGEGPVTITAVSDDGGFTVNTEILIRYTHIEELILDKEKVEMLAGETIALKATILPENSSNKKLNYKSQNTGVANVDENGVITGVSQGKTVITVTSEDGSKTAECTVTIHPRAIYVKEIPAQKYTGKAIKPALKVYDSGILLEQGKDYTVAYKNNTKAADKNAAKAPTAIIKMVKKGNYAGSQTVTFTIEPISLEEDNPEVTLDAMSVQATGKKLSPVPNVYWNGKKLKNKTDFTVTYPGWDQISAGEYRVQIDGKGNYSGTRYARIKVTSGGKVSVSKLKVTAATKPFRELTGNFKKDILNCLTVKSGKTDLYLDRDYEYVEGTSVGCETIGSCKFNIRGLKGYEGERTVTVKITGTSLTDKKVTEVNTAVYKYNGEAQKLSDKFKLKYNGTDIDPSNYEILEDTYQNNTNAGTASVVIEGRNEYYGRRTVKFVIQPITSGFSGKDVTVAKAYYTKGGSKPEVTVKGLTKDDYTVTYQNNKAVGFGTVIITGKGNYKGLSLSKSFRIERKDISETTLTVKDKVFSSKAGGYKSAPVLKDTDGKTLKAGTDYLKDIKYERLDNNGNVLFILGPKDTAGSGELIRVTVTGTGNYTGSITAEYRILYKGMDISKAKVSAATKEYTGNEITLGEDDLVVKIGTAVLTYGTDYEIIENSYTKNINKGTATVMIKGINDYGGVKTVKFKISQKNISSYWEGVKDFLSRLF